MWGGGSVCFLRASSLPALTPCSSVQHWGAMELIRTNPRGGQSTRKHTSCIAVNAKQVLRLLPHTAGNVQETEPGWGLCRLGACLIWKGVTRKIANGRCWESPETLKKRLEDAPAFSPPCPPPKRDKWKWAAELGLTSWYLPKNNCCLARRSRDYSWTGEIVRVASLGRTISLTIVSSSVCDQKGLIFYCFQYWVPGPGCTSGNCG